MDETSFGTLLRQHMEARKLGPSNLAKAISEGRGKAAVHRKTVEAWWNGGSSPETPMDFGRLLSVLKLSVAEEQELRDAAAYKRNVDVATHFAGRIRALEQQVSELRDELAAPADLRKATPGLTREERAILLALRRSHPGGRPEWLREPGAAGELGAALAALMMALNSHGMSPREVLSALAAMDPWWELPLVLRLVDQVWGYLTASFGTDPQKMNFRMGALQDEIARVWGVRAMRHVDHEAFRRLDDAMNQRQADPHPPHKPRRTKR